MRPYALTESLYNGLEYLQRSYQLDMLEQGESVRQITDLRINTSIDGFLAGHSDWQILHDGRQAFCRLDPLAVSVDSVGAGTTALTVWGPDLDCLERFKAQVLERFGASPPTVKWMFDQTGKSIELPVSAEQLPLPGFYPQVESTEQYWDRYLASNANVLLLIGPPGTGKTTFIRGLLHHANRGAIVSYDPRILEDDGIFADFMASSSRNFMILEDADQFLASRSRANNTVMHKFLNIGDGILSTGQKKLIFSTNLPSVRDVDEALLRPGRCFDVLRFGKLTPEQGRAINPAWQSTQDATLAEILSSQNQPLPQANSVGFVK